MCSERNAGDASGLLLVEAARRAREGRKLI